MAKKRILMVCLGNICRSPLAEGVMRSKLNPSKFEVDSAGTSGYHAGESPDPRSVEVARKNGIDISQLKGRQFVASDFQYFDYIFVMDKSNYANVVALAHSEQEKNKVSLLLDALGTPEQKELPDPYYGDKTQFRIVFSQIEKACEQIAQKLENQ